MLHVVIAEPLREYLEHYGIGIPHSLGFIEDDNVWYQIVLAFLEPYLFLLLTRCFYRHTPVSNKAVWRGYINDHTVLG